MATNVNVQLTGGTLQVLDNTASVIRVNSPIASLVAQASASFYDAYLAVPNPGPLALVLPGTTVWTVAVRNISATNNISITCTPQGGAAWASPYVLPPSSLFLIISSYSTNPAAGGLSAVSLSASGANTYAEVLLAA